MRSPIVAAVAVLAVVALAGSPAWAQNHAQHYVLDAYGGVHAGGGAPVISPATPYFGFDVAASIEYVAVGTGGAVGDGYMVLDKFGGVHHGGALAADPPVGGTPYFGFDAARSITLRNAPPRLRHVNEVSPLTVTSTTPIATTSIQVPMAGWLHVTGVSEMVCASSSGSLLAGLSLAVDSTDVPTTSRAASWPDCTTTNSVFLTQNQTVTTVVPVTAGLHTVELQAYKSAGTAVFQVWRRSLTVEFIAHDGLGQLSQPGAAAPGSR